MNILHEVGRSQQLLSFLHCYLKHCTHKHTHTLASPRQQQQDVDTQTGNAVHYTAWQLARPICDNLTKPARDQHRWRPARCQVQCHCYTQSAVSLSVVKIITSTHCVYPQRDGQAEWAWMAGYITVTYLSTK